MKLRIFSILLYFLIVSLAFSNPVWEQTNGPFSAQLMYITSDPQGYLYTITFSGNIYKSTNQGDIWTKLPIEDVTAIAFDKDNNCLIGNKDCEISLYDKDMNFVRVLRSSYLGEMDVHQIQVANNGYIFANYDFGKLIMSTNKGNTWQQIYYEMYEKFFVDSNNVIILTFKSGTIGRSTNYGLNWDYIKLFDTQFPFGLYVCAYNNCLNNHILAGFGKIIYTSTDKGLTWSPGKDSIPIEPVWDIMIDNNCDVFALGDSAVYRSSDGGNTWTKLKGFSNCKINSMIKSNEYLFCSSRDDGIIKYDFSSETTSLKNNGLINSWVKSIDINQTGDVFAATQSGIFKTSNSGADWTRLDLQSFSNESFNSILCTKDGSLFSGYDSVLIESTDDGISWQIFDFDDYIFSMAESDNGRIYIGGNKLLYFSDDNGITWQSRDFDTYNITSIATYSDKFVLVATYVGGVYLSNDFAETFEHLPLYVGENYGNLVAINQNGDMFVNMGAWMGGDATFRSLDTGKTFTKLNDIEYGLNFLKIDKKNNIYAGSRFGLQISRDNGDSWTYIGKGLFDTTGTSYICFDNNFTTYLGTKNDGVFKSNDFSFNYDITDKKDEIKIYPNPAQDEATLNIPTENQQLVKVRIFDLFGNIIKDYLPAQYDKGTNPFNINLNDMPVGIYYIKLNIGTKNYYSRLMITH